MESLNGLKLLKTKQRENMVIHWNKKRKSFPPYGGQTDNDIDVADHVFFIYYLSHVISHPMEDIQILMILM
jgi:hypothetical protein